MRESDANDSSPTPVTPKLFSRAAVSRASNTENRATESRLLLCVPHRGPGPKRRLGTAWATKAAAIVLAVVTGAAMLWIGVPPAFASSPPTVTAVIASSGPTSGGQQVTVMGANLASPTSVKFGTSSATIVSSTATTDTVTSPSGTLGSTVDVTVTTSAGTSATSSADQYSYVMVPTVFVVDNGASAVTPITVSTNTAGGTIAVGSAPRGVAIAPNGQTAYVTNTNSGTVTPINLATDTAGTPIAVGNNPWGIAITPNGQTAYVANDSSSGTVTPIKLSTNTAGTPITVGSYPRGIAITPNGQTAYVDNSNSNTVTPITIATNTRRDPDRGREQP